MAERTQEAIRKARNKRVTSRLIRSPVLKDDENDRWPLLATFNPAPSHLKRKREIMFGSPAAHVSFDILRTRLTQQMRKSGWTKVMVTSPRSACGKSTICVNLAMSIARQRDIRTVLLDFDLRKPTLAKILGFKSPHGVASLLEGRKTFEEQAVRVGDNLAICMGTEVSQSPAESLLLSQTHELIAEIEAEYAPDLMIFDVPPIYSNDDTAALAPSVDCALGIIAAGDTKISEIDSCERDLAAITNVAGLIINKCRYTEPGQGSQDEGY